MKTVMLLIGMALAPSFAFAGNFALQAGGELSFISKPDSFSKNYNNGFGGDLQAAYLFNGLAGLGIDLGMSAYGRKAVALPAGFESVGGDTTFSHGALVIRLDTPTQNWAGLYSFFGMGLGMGSTSATELKLNGNVVGKAQGTEDSYRVGVFGAGVRLGLFGPMSLYLQYKGVFTSSAETDPRMHNLGLGLMFH
jgi:hypothetical protein